MQVSIHDHRMFIDEQASYDLACGALADGDTWEALRDALDRAKAFWPYELGPAAPTRSGVQLL